MSKLLTWYLIEGLPMLKTVSSHGIDFAIINLNDTFSMFVACYNKYMEKFVILQSIGII